MKFFSLFFCSLVCQIYCQEVKKKVVDSPPKLPLQTSYEPTQVNFINSTSVRKVQFKTYLLLNKGDFAKLPPVPSDHYEELNIFCYQGVTPTVSLFWSSAALKLNLSNHNYEVYLSNNITGVAELAELRESEWFYSGLPWRSKEFKISPFENACVGIQTVEGYSISLQWKHVNYAMVAVTLAGLSMFMLAPKLCRNTFFQYTTGISVGLITSVIILTYLLQRRMKKGLFSWIGVVYSLSVYFITKTWYNIKEYLTEQYFHLVVGYVLVAGLISFAIMYRMGPPSDHRTLNLITWFMQLVSLIMVFLSSYHQTASTALILVVVTWSVIPAKLKSGVNTQIRKRFFKPKVKLLSEEEYNNQAHIETKKALEELKSFVRSPESKPWQTVSRLRDPKRFAEFVEGSPHLTENEVMEYSHWEYNTDDEDDDNQDNEADIYTDDEEADAASDENQDY